MFPSEEALMQDVRWLAAPERVGRLAGTQHEKETADWIARRFATAGLVPGGDQNSWLQPVPLPAGQASRNVVGILPGSTTGAWVLIGAHMDHLGMRRGQLHPGADDNASGIAALLAVAATWSQREAPRATVIFVAFGAEEAGLVGSRWLADHPPLPLDQCICMINLDMIGRSPFLGAKRYEMAKRALEMADGPAVGVLDTGSADLLPQVRAATANAGIGMHSPGDFPLLETAIRNEAAGRSDDFAFAAKGVPTLFFSTSLQDDYHRPSDTIEKIDRVTMRKVALTIWNLSQSLADVASSHH